MKGDRKENNKVKVKENIKKREQEQTKVTVKLQVIMCFIVTAENVCLLGQVENRRRKITQCGDM